MLICMFITAFHSFAMITEILTILNNFVKILDEFSINSCGRVSFNNKNTKHKTQIRELDKEKDSHVITNSERWREKDGWGTC